MKTTVAVNGYRVQYTGNAVEWARNYADNHPSDWVQVKVDGKIVYRRCDNAGCLDEE